MNNGGFKQLFNTCYLSIKIRYGILDYKRVDWFHWLVMPLLL
jgi:hypothetical protein